MFHHFVDSGAFNATFWFALAAFMAALPRWLPRNNRIALGAIGVALLLGTTANLALALYRGYAIPRDVMQDIVSAQELLDDRPIYPADMTQRINIALGSERPRASLFERWPNLKEREDRQRHEMLTSHWVQAHPPFMTLFTAPFARYLGVLGTQVAFLLIGFLCFGLIVSMIRAELFPRANGWHVAIIATALLGADSVLTVLRAGQTGLLLTCLLTASWLFLRRGRPGWAGMAAGVAISLKLVPGVLLLVFLMRHRKAFVWAIATMATTTLVCAALIKPQDFVDYCQTSRGIVAEYAAYSGNLSLLGTLARGARALDLGSSLGGMDHGFSLARLLWLVCGTVIAAAFAWQIRRPPKVEQRDTDVDLQYALAMSLMPFLSPVAWDHYLVYLVLPFSILASRVQSRHDHRQALGLLGLLVILAVPDSAFHWILDVCNGEGLHGLGTWLALNLRTAALAIEIVWLSRELGCVSRRPGVETEICAAIETARRSPQPQTTQEQQPQTTAAK